MVKQENADKDRQVLPTILSPCYTVDKNATTFYFFSGILIAVILAIAMVIGVFILTCGLVYIKRYRLICPMYGCI